MKKLILAILIVLPFLLVAIVAFSGKIIGDVNFVAVESVRFEGLEADGVLLNESVIDLQVGREYRLRYTVLPQTASDKNVTVNVDGGVQIIKREDGYYLSGNTAGARGTVTILSNNGGKKAEFSVRIIDEVVTSVTFLAKKLSLRIGERRQMEIKIISPTAPKQEVEWYCSDAGVARIDANGTVTALKAGTAAIEVRLKADPTIRDRCDLTVLDERPELYFEVEDPTAYFSDVAELDLAALLRVKAPLTLAEVIFTANQARNCTLSGSKITFTAGVSGQITVTAAASKGDTEFTARITVYYLP